jgi:hypothetical protein
MHNEPLFGADLGLAVLLVGTFTKMSPEVQ